MTGGGRIPATEADVFCAEAGTAARFLVAAAATGEGVYRFDAAPQLRRRPLALLLDALRAQGTRTEPEDAGGMPFTLLARGLTGGSLRLPGDTSSQFISALLMAAPLGRATLDLRVDGLVSRPYVTMTLRMMAQFGADAAATGADRFVVTPGAYAARDYTIEPDASTASYFFAAAATGGRVQVLGLHRKSALQGDVAFLDVLEAMGCTVTDEPEGVRVAGPASLAGLTVDMADISDTFMTLAAIAPLATSPVTITGIGNVRLKESDRIAAVEDNLRRLGVRTESGVDWLRVFPATPRGAHVDPHGDHRIAMAFSVLGLRVPGNRRRRSRVRRQDLPDVLRPLDRAGTGNRPNWANRGRAVLTSIPTSPGREGEHGRRDHGQRARRHRVDPRDTPRRRRRDPGDAGGR